MKKLSYFIAVFLSLFLYSCGGSGGESSGSTNIQPEVPAASTVQVTGRAVLGPLSYANVNVYCSDNLSDAVFGGKTSDYNINSYNQTGIFSFSDNNTCSFYLVEVNGGNDIDPNDDGIVNTTDIIKNSGKIRAFLTESSFTGNITVNVLTEIAYRILQSRLDIGYLSVNDLIRDLNTISEKLLSSDITGDNVINSDDLLHFDPLEHNIYFKHAEPGKSYEDLLPDDNTSSLTFIESIYENVGFNLDDVTGKNISDDLSNIYYKDEDGDGYSDRDNAVVSYEKPPGYSSIPPPIMVTTTEDTINPSDNKISLREAVNNAYSNQPVIFDRALDGEVIYLNKIADNHTILKGEVMGMRMEPSGPVSYLEGYFDRDYGKSALYARKNLILDASDLTNGITLKWDGVSDNKYARVLAVYGDLVLKNVSITGGNNKAEKLDSKRQPWTLSRGCGVAVWGTAKIIGSKIYHNSCLGDFDQARDRGAFGGGVYANIVKIEDSVISGNEVVGVGAAGGGVYSVGGIDPYSDNSIIKRSSISGNLIQGMFAYGGGIYSDGGSIGNQKKITVVNSTVTQNLAEPYPYLPSFLLDMGYWRGGGIYMSNGYMEIKSSTIVNNEVGGKLRIDDLNKPNIGGGGIAATIGNAHAVEDMKISQSIVAGNKLHYDNGTIKAEDIFTGSLLSFISGGYNLFGKVNFDHILVPVGEYLWRSLIRIHYPKVGDVNSVDMSQVLNLTTGIEESSIINSKGVDAGEPVILYYRPAGNALDKIPDTYSVNYVEGQYNLSGSTADSDFLRIFLDRLENYLQVDNLTNNFITSFEDFLLDYDIDPDTSGIQHYTDPDNNSITSLGNVNFYGPAETWPSNLSNYPYILFWQKLREYMHDNYSLSYDESILNENIWDSLFSTGYLNENSNIYMDILTNTLNNSISVYDQLGFERPANLQSDIGALEIN